MSFSAGIDPRVEMLVQDLNEDRLGRAVEIFAVLAHPTRVRILMALLAFPDGLSTKQLYVALHVQQAVVSQQLSILRNAGLVVSARRGQWSIHLLEDPALIESLNIHHLVMQER